jgi:hypothetical protein
MGDRRRLTDIGRLVARLERKRVLEGRSRGSIVRDLSKTTPGQTFDIGEEYQ